MALSAPVNVSQQGDNIIVPGIPGTIIGVTGYCLSGVGNNVAQWFSGTPGGKLLGGVAFGTVIAADDFFSVPGLAVAPMSPYGRWGQMTWFDTRPGDPLVLNLSDPNLVVGHVSYITKLAGTAPV